MAIEEDAVLAGFNTVRKDNPKLNVRYWAGKNPIRIIVDKNNQLDPRLNVFDKSQRTIIYNLSRQETFDNLEFVKINEKDLHMEMMVHLVKSGIHSILVEGGRTTHQAFIDKNIWDEARVFISESSFYRGIKAAGLFGHELIEKRKIKSDWLYIYKNTNSIASWLKT